MKKVLSILLASIFIMSCFGLSAYAYHPINNVVISEDFTVSFDKDGDCKKYDVVVWAYDNNYEWITQGQDGGVADLSNSDVTVSGNTVTVGDNYLRTAIEKVIAANRLSGEIYIQVCIQSYSDGRSDVDEEGNDLYDNHLVVYNTESKTIRIADSLPAVDDGGDEELGFFSRLLNSIKAFFASIVNFFKNLFA